MSAYEFRYDPIADVVQAIANGHVVKEFTCAYRGKVKATYIAQAWFGQPQIYPPTQSTGASTISGKEPLAAKDTHNG